MEVVLASGEIALVDADDFELASQYRWRAHKTRSGVYARAWTPMVNKIRKLVYLHRLIAARSCGPIGDLQVDHKNRNTLDNRRANLRLATRSQNCANKMIRGRPHKGVRPTKHGRWQATILGGGQSRFIGSFKTKAEAMAAYDREARRIYGEFAFTNEDIGA